MKPYRGTVMRYTGPQIRLFNVCDKERLSSRLTDSNADKAIKDGERAIVLQVKRDRVLCCKWGGAELLFFWCDVTWLVDEEDFRGEP